MGALLLLLFLYLAAASPLPPGDEGDRADVQSRRRKAQAGATRQRRAATSGGVAPLNVFLSVKDLFDARRRAVEWVVFQTLPTFSSPSKTGDGDPNASRVYTYNGFFESLRTMAADGILGDSYHAESNPYVPGYTKSGDDSHVTDEDNMSFYVGQDDPGHPNSKAYAVVNVAAFLSQAMAEAVQFDACEEFNGQPSGFTKDSVLKKTEDSDWYTSDLGVYGLLSELGAVEGRRFPSSAACGQLGRNYQIESCPVLGDDGTPTYDDGAMVDSACPIDATVEVMAMPHPRYNSKEREKGEIVRGEHPPPPLECRPKVFEGDYGGYWDGYSKEFVRNVAHPSTTGRIDTEGCAYWGRGMLMTRTTCGIGRLNFLMGRRAYEEGRPSRYPDVDFCKTPSVICGDNTATVTGARYPELKYLSGLVEWVDRIQTYSNPETGFDYLVSLRAFVNGGMSNADFIDDVSSILSRGCDGRMCSSQTIPFFDDRRKNFERILYDIFKFPGVGRTKLTYDYQFAETWLHENRAVIEGNVLVSQNRALGGTSYYSQEYGFGPFLDALRKMALTGAGEHRRFFLYDEDEGLRGLNAGLVNLSLFLANAMAESIADDSCDETHWDAVSGGTNGVYSLANPCGQNGREYGSEVCPRWQEFMDCPVDDQARIKAKLSLTSVPPFVAEEELVPPPFQCKARNLPVGGWDVATGALVEGEVPNSAGATSTRGCSFWGRGALLTRGKCNYGRLNFHLGKGADEDGREAPYPEVDFCANPAAVCDHEESMEIRWSVAMFEWIDRVQDYYDSSVDFDYIDELYRFVDGGMSNDAFVEQVSNILARGCHVHPCPPTSFTSPVKTNRFLHGPERRQNVKNAIRLVFKLPVLPPADPAKDAPEFGPPPASSLVTPRPTPRPTDPFWLDTPQPTDPPVRPPQPAEEGVLTLPPAAPAWMAPVDPTGPTSSPVEFSDITQYNDGAVYTIDSEGSSFTDESLVITRGTTLVLDADGYVEAPLNTDWPALRFSISSKFVGNGGSVLGSYADTSYVEGDYENGGDAIHLNNGQSGSDTGSTGEFRAGINVMGGNAPGGVGGDALSVNGFGSEASIFGGNFVGGTGLKGDGLSLNVLNGGIAHVRGGTFGGDMVARSGGTILLYGCFKQDGDVYRGIFQDETELVVTARTTSGGDVIPVAIAEVECEDAPSMEPTNYPTVSPRPTVPRPSDSCRHGATVAIHLLVGIHLMLCLLKS